MKHRQKWQKIMNKESVSCMQPKAPCICVRGVRVCVCVCGGNLLEN